MKKLLSVLLVCVLVFTLAGCGSPAKSDAGNKSNGDAKPPTEQYERATVRVAYMPNMGSGSAIIAGIEKGYFDEVGLDVKLTQFEAGPAEIAAMSSGDIDISQIGHGAHALVIEGKAKIFALDLLGNSDEVLVNKDKGIKTVADLKGKTIASTSGTSAEVILNLVLQSAGMTKNDVKIVEMDANGAVTAMVSGNVDACATWAPSSFTIKKKMGDKVLSLGRNEDFVDKVSFPGSFIATEKFATENEDILVRFTQALLKAMDFRAANVEQVCKWLAKEVEADEATILETKDSYMMLTSDYIKKGLGDGTIENLFKGQQGVFIDSGRIPKEVPVSDYVLFNIMQKAIDANGTAAK